jgi:hypothetical protein
MAPWDINDRPNRFPWPPVLLILTIALGFGLQQMFAFGPGRTGAGMVAGLALIALALTAGRVGVAHLHPGAHNNPAASRFGGTGEQRPVPVFAQPDLCGQSDDSHRRRVCGRITLAHRSGAGFGTGRVSPGHQARGSTSARTVPAGLGELFSKCATLDLGAQMPNHRAARPRKAKKPTTSVTVVTKTLDEMAGSILK